MKNTNLPPERGKRLRTECVFVFHKEIEKLKLLYSNTYASPLFV